MALKHTYTALAQDHNYQQGTLHTRTTARTYTHCIVASGYHRRYFHISQDTWKVSEKRFGELGMLAWAGTPELAAKQVAKFVKDGYTDVQAVPCTLKPEQVTSRRGSKATKVAGSKKMAKVTKKSTASKGTKGKATKATKARKATGPKVDGLTGQQVRILTAVAKAKGNVSYGDVRVATGILKGLSRMMVATSSKGASYPNSLEGLGLIKSHEAQDNHGRARFCFAVTAKGTKALKGASVAPKAAKKAAK